MIKILILALALALTSGCTSSVKSDLALNDAPENSFCGHYTRSGFCLYWISNKLK